MTGGRAARLLLALSLAGTLAACGNGSRGGPGASGADPAGPSASPPALKGNGPPLAWAESGAGADQRVWMAFSSYCWGQTCADYLSPVDRDDIPVLRADLGSPVVFHLGFEPTSAGLAIPDGESLQLTGSGRDRTWTADRSALLVLNATDASNEQGSYVVQVALGDPEPSPTDEPEHHE